MDLESAPFNLKEEQIHWVDGILAKMTISEKIGQMLIIHGIQNSNNNLKNVVSKIQPGGVFLKYDKKDVLENTSSTINESSKTPPLICGSFQNGYNEIIARGVSFGSEMQIAATKNLEYAKKTGEFIGEGVKDVGINTNFGPNVDLHHNWRSGLNAINTYGSNPQEVSDFSLATIGGFESKNVLSIVKQFPGDGIDERDYRMLSTVNTLPIDEWDESYGEVYRKLIEGGLKAIMVGNIALPHYVNESGPEDEYEYKLPVSLSKVLLQELLRDDLEFNGLIVCDSTTLLGFSSEQTRSDVLPRAIEAGCDMIVCSKDYIKDYVYILQGIKKGLISIEKINESVRRILATKASIGLGEVKEASEKNMNISYDIRKHISLSKSIADDGITLVKDYQKILPLSEKYKKILIVTANNKNEGTERSKNAIKLLRLNLENMKRTTEERSLNKLNNSVLMPGESINSFTAKYDLVIFLFNIKSDRAGSILNLGEERDVALKSPLLIEEVPSIFISLANPYHSFELPMFKTFINCYSENKETIEVLVKKLVGKSSFTGQSPVNVVFDFYGNPIEPEEE